MPERRLLVITGDPLQTLLRTGRTPAFLASYYNPAEAFHEMRVLDLYDEQAVEGLSLLRVPAAPAMGAWRQSILDPWSAPDLRLETLTAFFPGTPDTWLTAVREYAPACIRAYEPIWSGFLATELGRALDIPVIVSVHNTMGICGEVLKRADQVIAVSEAVAARCVALGANPARVVTMLDRVDRERFTPSGDAAPAPAGSPKLLVVAREHAQKNLDRLLQACGQLLRDFPTLQLVHVGRSGRDWSSWPFVTHYDALPHDELPQWFRWADALVLPSLWEGFGMVLAEALACGTPCITSNRPPMDEIVTDRWDGLLVDPESVDDIARAIREIADPAVQARLAAPARTSSERFDSKLIDQREAVIYSLVLRDQWPLLSVVLPTYNRASLIESAVRNVLDQDYPNLELIVVNDGSKDDTAAVLATLNDPRLRVITRENGGLPVALNSGFAQARGEYWTWTSDDNAYRPGALRAMARELELAPGVGLVYADMQITDEHGNSRLFQCGPPERVEGHSTIGLCFLYRASVARKVGEYDPALRLAEDYDYWLRFRKHAPLLWLPRVLYDCADQPGTLTRRELHAVHEARLKLLQREFGAQPDWADTRFRHFLRFSAMAKQYGLVGSALRTAAGAIRQRPASPAAWKAMLRALTPRFLLRLTRRMRGLDDS